MASLLIHSDTNTAAASVPFAADGWSANHSFSFEMGMDISSEEPRQTFDIEDHDSVMGVESRRSQFSHLSNTPSVPREQLRGAMSPSGSVSGDATSDFPAGVTDASSSLGTTMSASMLDSFPDDGGAAIGLAHDATEAAIAGGGELQSDSYMFIGPPTMDVMRSFPAAAAHERTIPMATIASHNPSDGCTPALFTTNKNLGWWALKMPSSFIFDHGVHFSLLWDGPRHTTKRKSQSAHTKSAAKKERITVSDPCKLLLEEGLVVCFTAFDDVVSSAAITGSCSARLHHHVRPFYHFTRQCIQLTLTPAELEVLPSDLR